MQTDSPVRAAVMNLVAAWNSCDCCGFGALFTEEAVYVALDGTLYEGRTAIEGLLADTKQHFQVCIEGRVSTDMHGDTARAMFRWSSNAKANMRSGTISCELVRQEVGWRIGSLKNSATLPEV
jgi:uncharacterized protein (TIGR02246 family)